MNEPRRTIPAVHVAYGRPGRRVADGNPGRSGEDQRKRHASGASAGAAEGRGRRPTGPVRPPSEAADT